MAASITLELDVTPPLVEFGEPSRLGDLRAIVPYTVDGDGLVIEASITNQPATVEVTRIVSAQAFPLPGLLDVQGLASDDVGNTVAFSDLIWLGPVPRPPVDVLAFFSDRSALDVEVNDRRRSVVTEDVGQIAVVAVDLTEIIVTVSDRRQT